MLFYSTLSAAQRLTGRNMAAYRAQHQLGGKPYSTKTLYWIISFFLFCFRSSPVTANATCSTRGRMGSLPWWPWRAGWGTGWSWCWTFNRTSTSRCGARLVRYKLTVLCFYTRENVLHTCICSDCFKSLILVDFFV